jgi:hypothetical protein
MNYGVLDTTMATNSDFNAGMMQQYAAQQRPFPQNQTGDFLGCGPHFCLIGFAGLSPDVWQVSGSGLFLSHALNPQEATTHACNFLAVVSCYSIT